MLVGGDLGILCLVLGVVLFVPLIGFAVRRKWRLAAARSEEIKRLLVLASEEAARAELEASTGFVASTVSFSGQLQYHCAVCFRPTSTRCARCKAVRYCSGKCQIIHWRQGHKEECRPFTATHQISDAGDSSSQEAFNQEECRAKPVQEFLEEPAFSNSSCSSKVVCGKDGIGVEYLADEKETNSASKITSHPSSGGVSTCTISSESSADVAVSRVNSSHHADRLDGQYSSNIGTNKLETASANNGQSKPQSLELFTLSNSVDSFNSSRKLNEIKADSSDAETRSQSTNSSGWTVDGSNESSFSEPSTPSSGFWEGTIDSIKSKCDLLDDSVQSSFSEAGDGSISDFQSSLFFNSARDAVPLWYVQEPDSSPTSLGIKKPIDGADISQELSKNFLKPKSRPLLRSEVSNRMDVGNTSDSNVSKCRENRYFSSSASYVHPASGIGGHSTCTNAPNIRSVPSLGSEKVHHMVDGMNGTSHALKSKKVGSLSSKASGAEKHGKVDGVHTVSASSFQFSNCSSNAGNGLKTSMWKVVDQLKPSNLSRHYPLGIGSEISGRYNNKVLLPYEMFVKLYNSDTAELRPCGLTNCGNSCYANAVLQCLAFTPPLTAYLLQGIHSKACEKKGWCFTCEFENLIMKAKEGNSSPLSPIRILTKIQNIGSHLGNGREEDAHEFLRYAIDTMQSVCLKEAGVNASGSLEEETTLIGLTFGGYLRSKIKCMKCGGKSEQQEKMMDLTVEIEGDIGTLEEALRQFTGTEILDGANKYHCSRCKSYEKAKKKLTVLEAPNVLTIALKRFQSGKFGKLNKAIRFPEILNLAPYMRGTSDKSPIYRLYGVVVHLDVMNATFSGHYICYVKNIQNKWFKIDDSRVEAVELEGVLTKGAYMLLYARCSPRAPRVIRNSVAPRDPRQAKTPTFKARPQPLVTVPDPLNVQANVEPFYTNHVNLQYARTHFEEDSSSDNSSNFGFSEEGSCSTESTRGSTSADDFLDQIFGDFGQNWNSHWRNLSDSDTSSSSSSPSPLYSRHSPLADLDRHTSIYSSQSGGLHIDSMESTVERNGLRARLPGRNNNPEDCEVKGSANFWYSDTTKQSRKSASSSSCRQDRCREAGKG